ncbi:MAG: VWA domain-containing protein [Phycisphaerales bacterium]|jgi:Ca-activated chloride channel family protein
MTFHPSSWWLLVLLPLALLPLWRARRAARATVRFSALHAVDHAPRGRMTRLRATLPLLRAAALACLVIALARPVLPNESTRTLVEGVAIELVVDRSDSMRALDFQLDDKPANRLDALKDVATRFIKGGEGFAGRPNDLVGIIAFAGKSDSMVPLTLDHDVTVEALAQIDFPTQQSEMGTAIGDAVALGVDKLKDAADRANRDGRARIKSRVLLLFTDGESNAGELSPQEATALAQSTDVRIYAVGLGTKGFANVPVQTPFGTRMQRVPVSIDEKTLTEMATATGGRYFRATDSDSLRQIYETIDALEKSGIEESKRTRYRELAVEGFAVAPPLLGALQLPGFAAIALILLAVETLLACTRLRSLA